MTQGLKKYEAVVNSQNKTTQLNPYNNQPIIQPKQIKPIIPYVQKAATQVVDFASKPIQAMQTPKKDLFTEPTKDIFKEPSKNTNKVQTTLESSQNEPNSVSYDAYGTMPTRKAYDVNSYGKSLEELDPESQAVINKSLSKPGLFGEKGIAYNFENIVNRAAQLPQSMVNAYGYFRDVVNKITPGSSGFSDEVKDFNDKLADDLKGFKIVEDRREELLKKYDGQIGSIDKFAADVVGNAIDMLPTIAASSLTGGVGSMTYLFFNAGQKAEEQALLEGAKEDDAFVYGLLSGGLEVGTEMMFGGIGGIAKKTMPKGFTALFDTALQQLSKNPIAKAFVTEAIDVVGEGFEEVVAEVVGNYFKLVYTDSIKSGKELTDDVIYAGLLGMFSSGFMKLGQVSTLKTLEKVANSGNISKLTPEKSVRLSTKLANNLNYDFEMLSREDAIAKYGADSKTKENIMSGGAFVVTEARENGKNGSIVVIDDGTGKNAIAMSTMHEVTHLLENTKTYNELTSLVKKHMGEEQYQEFVDLYSKLYDVKQDEMYKSGVRISESEFIAQQIIQNQLFGLDSQMRVSFIQRLAGEKPRLFTRLSDNIDSFLKNTRNAQLDPNKEDERNYLEYIQYMENLRNIFKTATDEYQTIKDSLNIEGTQIQNEIKLQKTIDELKNVNPQLTKVYEDSEIQRSQKNIELLKPLVDALERDVTKAFNLTDSDINTIYTELYDMSEETADNTVLMFESLNDALDKRFKTDVAKMTDKEVINTEQFIRYAQNLHTMLQESKVVYGNIPTETKEVTKPQTIEEERTVLADKEVQKILENNSVKLKAKPDDRELVVLHNLDEQKFLKTISLGGFAMPSLAVTKSSIPHHKFGDITIIFNKDILKNSPTFTADAYTPVFPREIIGFNSKDGWNSFEKEMEKYKGLDGYTELKYFISEFKNGSFYNAESFYGSMFHVDSNLYSNKLELKPIAIKIYEDYLGKKFNKDDYFIDGKLSYPLVEKLSNEIYELRKKFLIDSGAKTYFLNDVDYANSNTRTSISKRMMESTIENAVKYMRSKGDLIAKESNYDYGLMSRKARMNSVMKSAKDVIKNKDLLSLQDSDYYNLFFQTHDTILRFINYATSDFSITGKNDNGFILTMDNFLLRTKNYDAKNISDYFLTQGYDLTKTIENEDLLDMLKVESEFNGLNTYAELLSRILENVRDIRVSYFESKPKRVVEFSEIEKVLIPNDTSEDMIEALNNHGIPFEIYEHNNDIESANGRLDLIKNMKEVQFQLVPTFKEDSSGRELTDEQLLPIFLSRAVDEKGRIKVVNRNDREGYLNIEKPFDTRTRKNAALVEEFAYNNNLKLVNGLLNETDANLFLAYIVEQGLEYDGITYNDNGSIGYIANDDSQFYPLDSLESISTLLSNLRANTGVFANMQQQIAELEKNTANQIIQANKEFYKQGYEEYLKYEQDAQFLYENDEDFREQVDASLKTMNELSGDNEWTLEEIQRDLHREYSLNKQKQFRDDYNKYLEWSKINVNESTVVVNNKLRQSIPMDYSLHQGRLEYGLEQLTRSESLDIIEKTKKNFDKDGRFYDVYEMIDPKVLVQFRDFNRMSKPMYKENFREIMDSVKEEGFREPIWLLANENTGFTLVGEGNHRVFLALMVGIDRLPVVATRSNYNDPRLVTDYMLSNGGFVDVNGIKPISTYSKPSDISSEFIPTEVKFQLTPQQEEFYKNMSTELRDKDGNPKILYHGSKYAFTVFNIDAAGQSNKMARAGYWFTESRDGALDFSSNVWYGDMKNPYAYAVYLNITNPKIYTNFQVDEEKELVRKKMHENYYDRKALDDKWLENLRPYYSYSHIYTREELESVLKYKVSKNRIDEFIEDVKLSEKLYEEYKVLDNQFDELDFSDAYENFRTDVYKTVGKTARDANIGGVGMVLDNAKEVLDNYRNGLIAQGYDGIVIKNTRFDSSVFGGRNDQYVAFFPEQIKSIDNLNPTDDKDIRFQLSQEQKEFFKDSKARDEQGNLVEVYHGTRSRFNKFSKLKLGDNTQANSALEGFFFTSNPDMADVYRKPIDDFYNHDPLDEYLTLLNAEELKNILLKSGWNKEQLDYNYNENLIEDLLYEVQGTAYKFDYFDNIDGYRDLISILKELGLDNKNKSLWTKVEKEFNKQQGYRMETYLNITNPLIVDDFGQYEDESFSDAIKEAKKQGRDGVIFRNVEDGAMGTNMESPVGDVYVVFEPNQIKNVDNLNPTSNPDIRFQLDPNNPLLKVYSPSLTKNEQDELQMLKGVDNAFGIIPGDKDYNRYVQLLEKEQSLVKFKKLLDVKEFDDVKKEYQKAKKEVNNDTAKYDKQLLNTITGFVKGYRDTGKRTKTEWLFIANQYGSQYKAISQEDLLEQALYTWIVLNPNNKENLNRQGQSYVDFGVEEWIQEMAKGAGGGTIQNLVETPVQEQRIEYEEKVKVSRHASQTAPKTSSPEVNESIEDQIDKGKLNYVVMSDVISVREANKNIKEFGTDEVLRNLQYKFNNGEIPTKVEIAAGEILFKKLTQERRTQEAIDLLTSLSILGTELGQAIQGLSLINKLSPSGQLMALEKGIKRIKKNYKLQGKGELDLTIPQEYKNYFFELEGKIQDLADSNQEYNNLVETLTRLENEVRTMEQQNASLNEISRIKNQIELYRQQQVIDAETQKRIDGLQLELDELDALPKITNELKAQQDALRKEISGLKNQIRMDNKIQENIFKLESQLKALKLEVSEEDYARVDELKQQIKDQKQKEKELKKLIKILEKMTNPKAIEEKIDETKRLIAKQMPTTWVDKLNAWRYLSMLGNPKTHIRNILGNSMFYPVFIAKDMLGVAMEKFLPQEQRTKAILPMRDIELRQVALDDFKEMYKTITSTSKYDLMTDLNFNKQIFKTKWLEAVRNKNFDWLQAQDDVFLKLAYTHAFGMIVKARGLDYNNLTEEQLTEVRKFAIEEARKATYRDTSKLAQALNELERKNKVGRFLMSTMIPFKKTPINILKRGIEYSPLSIFIGIKQFAFDIKSGRATPAQALDSITTGLTGVGIMGLGMLLFSMGILNVGDDDDESDKKKYYDRALGKQRYSLNVGDGTYTIDWIVPAIMPLIIGGELAKSFSKESDESLVNQLTSATFSIMDPVFELSMLQGVMQTLTSYSSSGSETVGNVISQLMANYVGQLIPTLSGQIGRVLDPYQRSTIATKDSKIGKWGEQTLRKLANKVFFLTWVNAPVIDIRGKKVVQYDNIVARAFMNLFSPGFYKDGTITEQDKEILKMYDLTKNNAVLPRESVTSYKYKNKDYLINNAQAEVFEKVLGEVSYDQLETLFNSSGYSRLTTDEKVKLIEDTYEYAYNKAKEVDLKSRGVAYENSGYSKQKKAEAVGLKVVDYLLIKYEFDRIKADGFNTKKDKFITYLRKMGYGDKLNKILPLFDIDLF